MSYVNAGVQSLRRLELSNKPTLFITKSLRKQIDYLHDKIGGKEWSGELITREEGVITQLDGWKVIAEDIFLAGIGTAAYTDYKAGEGAFKSVDIVELVDRFPGIFDGTHKNHHVHSHNNMGVFFSGTDWEQLEERGILANYLIMLIVNIAGDAIAKVAFKAKLKSSGKKVIELFNNDDGFDTLTMGDGTGEEEVLVVMDMLVVQEEMDPEEGDWFKDRYKTVQKANTYTPAANSSLNAYRGSVYQGGLYDKKDDIADYRDYSEYEVPAVKTKRIGELNDAEWEKMNSELGGGELFDFDQKDANQLLNNTIDNTYMGIDKGTPIPRLRVLSAKTRSAEVRDVIKRLHEDLYAKFAYTYPKASEEDYLLALDVIIDSLKTFKYDTFIGAFVVKLEIEVSKLSKTRSWK